jgi:hypothetical protein
MPVVCCLGEAAGAAASIALDSGVTPREIDVTALQNSLKANGAFIGI